MTQDVEPQLEISLSEEKPISLNLQPTPSTSQEPAQVTSPVSTPSTYCMFKRAYVVNT